MDWRVSPRPGKAKALGVKLRSEAASHPDWLRSPAGTRLQRTRSRRYGARWSAASTRKSILIRTSLLWASKHYGFTSRSISTLNFVQSCNKIDFRAASMLCSVLGYGKTWYRELAQNGARLRILFVLANLLRWSWRRGAMGLRRLRDVAGGQFSACSRGRPGYGA